jgi:NNP family nitrate/nitrite transporter-like MFS transporter
MKLLQAIKSGHPGSLFSAFLYFDISFMVWVILGPLAVYISQDFTLTSAQKGLMVAIPILSGALLRIPMGVLTDWIGPKKAGIFGLIMTLVPLVWGWQLSHNLTHITIMGLLLGVAGASFAVALPLASRWYPAEHQGIALGIAGAGNSGTVLAALLAPRLAEFIGWHGVLGLATIPTSLTLLIFILLAQDTPEQPEPKPLGKYLNVLNEPDVWWFNCFYAITFGGFVGLASYLVIFFVDQYGLARVTAGNFTAACVFAGSFFRPIGGYLADRFGGVKVLSILYGLVTLCMVGLSTIPSLVSATTLLFLGMLCLGMGNGSVFQLVPQRYLSEVGVVTGIVGAAGGIGGFFIPTVLGQLKDLTGSYGTGFFAFSLVALLGLILLQTIYHFSWQTSWLAERMEVKPLEGTRVRMEVVFGG